MAVVGAPRYRYRMSRLPIAFVVTGFALAVACVSTPPAPTPTAAPEEEAQTEVEPARLCRVVAEVRDAEARSALGALRLRYELTSSTDRHAAFGAMLAQSKNEDRFRAFHDDGEARNGSVVAAVGECLVYTDWKMEKESLGACARARTALGNNAAVIDAAAVDTLARSDATAAVASADAALKRAPGCEALHLSRARAVAQAGDVEKTTAAWLAAAAAFPNCFVCAVERAKTQEGTNGRAAAATAWEDALKIAPDHADTLRRFAASVAGVDDRRALSAYEAAVAAGARDFPTLIAAARLATRLAASPADVDRALVFARRASEVQRTDPDARRLVVELAMRKGDDAAASAAAQQLLDLVPDDVAAHVALARAAAKADKLEDAVVHYDLANVELAAGRIADLDEATVAAVRAERQGLLSRLMVDDGAAPAGSASTVANLTQKGLQKLWKDRLKKKVVKAGGVLTVVVETNASGAVIDVVVKSDVVTDPMIRAAAVAWMRRASITGGAKRYTLELLLQ